MSTLIQFVFIENKTKLVNDDPNQV